MSRKQKRNLFRIALASCFFIAGLLIRHSVVSLCFLLLAYAVIGWDVLQDAFGGIIRGQVFDENFLMAIATIGALAIGEYHEAVAVMLFYQIGEFFQQYAVGKSRESIAALMDIRPEAAYAERNGTVAEVDPEEVEVGEILVIHAGDRIPLDGVVIEGSSSLDTSALTGESLPHDVSTGDEVVSGCINQTGLLRIRATKPYHDSTVAKILDMVENASDKKARVESFITRFARVYTPCVCIAALVLFLLPPVISGGGWKEWGYRALSFLVVSCPCALVISVPLSFFGGVGGASRCGILMKGSNDLEALANAGIVVFDKTGTLTRGKFRVTDIVALEISEEQLLHMAALLESTSLHPISRSVCEAYEKAVETDELTDVQERGGYGISAVWRGARLCVGNVKWMKLHGIKPPENENSGTIVYVARNESLLGWLIVSDELKEGASEAVCAIKNAGVKRMVMLTGDHWTAANAIAAQCGINEVYAGLLPGDKVERVEKLLSVKPMRSTLVFAGDGINDAPVLTRADVGVAMGALGSDAAIEAADIVLMDDDLRKLALAIQISRRTLAIARQNIVFALAVKLLVLVLVALGFAGMWLAVFADVGVSVIAILNAMRALRVPVQLKKPV